MDLSGLPITFLGVFTGSPKRLNNKKLALEIFQKAETEAEEFFHFNDLACSIADEDYLGDKNYAKKVFQQAENLAAVENTNTQYESFKRFLALGQSYGFSLGDKNLARKAFEKKQKILLKIGGIKNGLLNLLPMKLI